METKKEIEKLERLIRDEKDTIENLSSSLNHSSRNLFRYQTKLNKLKSNS